MPHYEITIPDFSLTELPNNVLPSVDLPETFSGGFPSYNIEIPEISLTAPEAGSLTTEIPSLDFGIGDIQSMIDEAMAAYGANATGGTP